MKPVGAGRRAASRTPCETAVTGVSPSGIVVIASGTVRPGTRREGQTPPLPLR